MPRKKNGDIEDVQPKGELVVSAVPAKVERPPRLVITRHKISRVMFELITLPVHPDGRVLSAYTSGGNVFMEIEEPSTLAVAEIMLIRGFRAGPVDLKRPRYICTIVETYSSGGGYKDHAHIYAELG